VCNRKAEQGRLVSIDLQGTPGLGMWIQVADHWARRKRIAGRRPSKFTAGHRKGDKGQTNKDESWPYYWHVHSSSIFSKLALACIVSSKVPKMMKRDTGKKRDAYVLHTLDTRGTWARSRGHCRYLAACSDRPP
jgi:hypothetical protein